MADINLLPKDFGPDPRVAELSGRIKKALIVEVLILSVIILVSLASLVFISNKNQKLMEVKNEKIQSIQSLEGTEQKIVLIKDRLSKVREIIQKDKVASQIDKLDELIESLPDDVDLKRVDLHSGRTEGEFAVANSRTLVDFLSSTSSSFEYEKVELISLNYNQNKGFAVKLGLVRKK